MSDHATLLAEAYRRGILPPQQADAYEEGVRRGLVRDAYAKGRLDSASKRIPTTESFNEASRHIPFVDEASAGLAASYLTATGAGKGKNVFDRFGDNWKLSRDYQEGVSAGFNKRAPVRAGLNAGAGYVAQAIPAIASGGATVAPSVARKGVVAATKRVAAGTARNATVGAGAAYANAAGESGTLEERAQAGNAAIPAGAALGVAVPAAVGGVVAAGRAAAKAAAPAIRATTRAANNAMSRTPAGGFLDPQTEAFKRLGETLKADGFTPAEIQGAMTEWSRVGGPSPAFMDLIAQGGRGQRTMALIRGAAVSGGGRNAATQYGNQVAVDLQDNAIARTRQLTPEQRPAADVAKGMREDRSKLATEQYAGPYAEQVPVTEEVAGKLTDAPGKSALRQARADALERQDSKQLAEIDALLRAEPVPTNPFEWYAPPPKSVSGATLDRTQIAMRERGDKLARAGNNARAGGARDRRATINRTLDEVPQLKEARGAYRDASRNIEGVEKVGPRVLQESPDVYAANVEGLGPGARPAVGVGAARAVEDSIGRPAEGSTGVLNRIATGTNTGRNLAATYGDEAAGDYRQAIRQMRDQLNNARYINPNEGSKTAGLLADQTLVESIPTTPVGLALKLVNKVRAGATLSDSEREVLVKLATSKPYDVTKGLNVFMEDAPPPIEFGSRPTTNLFAIPMGSQENRR